jgi:predicted Fe-Mo cluster-binding NifX family protein
MGVNVVLTGFVGHHGLHILQSAGIEVITGFEGTVGEAVERYKARFMAQDKK